MCWGPLLLLAVVIGFGILSMCMFIDGKTIVVTSRNSDGDVKTSWISRV